MELLTVLILVALIVVVILFSELSEVKEQRNSLTKENEQLQKKLSEAENRNKRLQEKLINAKKENNRLQKKLSGTDVIRNRLHKRLSEANNENNQLQKKLSGADVIQNRLHKRLSEAKDKNEQLQKELSEAELGSSSFPIVSEKRYAELKAMPYDEDKAGRDYEGEVYLKTPEWKKRAEIMRARFENRCQVCYSRKRLNVHHRTYERHGNEKATDLTVLCKECHDMVHKRYPRIPRD